MKRYAVACAALFFLAGCGSVLSTVRVPAGQPVVIGAIPCEAVIEFLDEDGDGSPDFFTHRPDPECKRRFLEAPPAPKGRSF